MVGVYEGFGHSDYLFVGQFRVNGEREFFGCDSFGYGKISFGITEVLRSGVEVDRHGVVAPATYAGFPHFAGDTVAFWCEDGEDVVGVHCSLP